MKNSEMETDRMERKPGLSRHMKVRQANDCCFARPDPGLRVTENIHVKSKDKE